MPENEEEKPFSRARVWTDIETICGLPLNGLRAFALVYAHGGVRPAARELRVAHSAVSRHLREVERWLGVPLVQEARGAGRRRIILTPEGEALAASALAALGDISRAAGRIRPRRSPDAVTLAVPGPLASRWLLPRVPILEAACPWVELSVLVEPAAESVGSGADLEIRPDAGGPPGRSCEPLLNDAVYPVMSRRYWERAGRPNRPDDLLRLRLLHDRDPGASWERWKQAFGPPGLDARRGLQFSATDLLLRAAAHGHGVALGRDRLVADEVEAGLLIRPLGPLQLDLGSSFWLCRCADASPRPAVNTVIEWLKGQATRRSTGDAPKSAPDSAP